MPQINRPSFQPGPQQLALMQVLQGLFNQPSTPTPWGFHEPSVTAGAGVEAGLQGAGQVLDDPRNAWMGIGPIAMAARPMGWGAEVLRRYKLLGGTPETLNKTLTNRMMEPDARNNIVRNFQMGTDLAAPQSDTAFGGSTAMKTGWLQNAALTNAGNIFTDTSRSIPTGNTHLGNSRRIIDRPTETIDKLWADQGSFIPSGTKGQAAYDAVSRQVGRLLDSVGYTGRRPGYGPKPLSESDFRRADRAERRQEAGEILGGMQRELGRLGEGPNARPNVHMSQEELRAAREAYNRMGHLGPE